MDTLAFTNFLLFIVVLVCLGPVIFVVLTYVFLFAIEGIGMVYDQLRKPDYKVWAVLGQAPMWSLLIFAPRPINKTMIWLSFGWFGICMIAWAIVKRRTHSEPPY